MQEPWHPRQRRAVLTELIERQALEEGRAPGAVARDWFDAYWHCAVEPCLVLFDHHGIALEAHQQNSLLRLAEGYPETYYYRDNQGFYLDEQQKPKLLQWQPTLDADSDLFYPTDAILDRFGYYLLVNQVFAVVDRLGADGLLAEAELIERVRDKLEALRLTLSGNGRVLIERWLTQTQLPAKANLLTRVEDIDELEADMELAAYTTIDNPLCVAARIERPLEEAVHV
ncbi:IucA/IucC family C-terminal-domain containing protein [Marinimicrobium koreense]|uniref:IucA/IucC family C-terminal-domain containing protein n=1 Tax=Marinimicrobium koreense TaxID=306545 RepID=UPI003F6EBDFC